MKTAELTRDSVMAILEKVADPEIPVISIVDLGIVRKVVINEGLVTIELSPTYSGCPALDVIPILVREALAKEGIDHVDIRNVIAPPWTTDWISPSGLEKLQAFGIAPPHRSDDAEMRTPLEDRKVACPQCGSYNTELISRFGSTPCKAAFRCKDCLEPFDYFKCH